MTLHNVKLAIANLIVCLEESLETTSCFSSRREDVRMEAKALQEIKPKDREIRKWFVFQGARDKLPGFITDRLVMRSKVALVVIKACVSLTLD